MDQQTRNIATEAASWLTWVELIVALENKDELLGGSLADELAGEREAFNFRELALFLADLIAKEAAQ